MSTSYTTSSGPAPMTAMLRAMLDTTARTLSRYWTRALTALARTAHLAKAATSTALAVIGSRAGYDTITHVVKKVVTTGWGLLTKAASWVGRLVRKAGNALTKGTSFVSPTTAAWVAEATTRWIVRPVTTLAATVTSWVSLAGQVVWELSRTSLVRTATVLAAQIGSLVLAVHAVSRGAVASRIVSTVPALFDVVLAITNPVKVVAIVAGVFVAACIVAFMRLPSTDGPGSPASAEASTAMPLLASSVHTAPAPAVDLLAVAAKLTVDVAPDGSVTVNGIPADLPEVEASRVAAVAAEAAVKQLRRILSVRPTPSRDDRRLIVKVAREAVRAQARSSQAA